MMEVQIIHGVLSNLFQKHNKYLIVKGISFKENSGKSAALNVGFSHALGDVVITMDGDLQDDPKEIPNFYDAIMLDGFDLVSGWKKNEMILYLKLFQQSFII